MLDQSLLGQRSPGLHSLRLISPEQYRLQMPMDAPLFGIIYRNCHDCFKLKAFLSISDIFKLLFFLKKAGECCYYFHCNN